MIELDLDADASIIRAAPHGAITEYDIKESIGPEVDRLLKEKHHIHGVLVDAREFEGWENFSAFVDHMQFIRDHHQHVDKIAVAGSESLQGFLSAIMSLITDVEFKFFKPENTDEAFAWLKT